MRSRWRDHRLAFVQPADELKIETTSDAAVYKPGDEARIRFRVTNSKGEGVQAALGLQVVDEAVFALAEKQPGFAKVFFYLEQEVMKPRYEIHSISMPATSGDHGAMPRAISPVRATLRRYRNGQPVPANSTGSSGVFCRRVNAIRGVHRPLPCALRRSRPPNSPSKPQFGIYARKIRTAGGLPECHGRALVATPAIRWCATPWGTRFATWSTQHMAATARDQVRDC